MTKSLLTAKDIKNFIYEVAQKVKQGEPTLYFASQLANILGCDADTITRYVRAGMPYKKISKRKKYILKDVINWLDDKSIKYELKLDSFN